VIFAGCGPRGLDRSPVSGSAPQQAVIRIGHQRADPLNLLQLRGDLDRRLQSQGVKVEWLDFPAGPQLLEAMAVGSIDIGSTGELPPIFAQAAGMPVVYIANIPLGPRGGEGQAILVPANSPVRTVADLKGRKVAFQKASGAHNLVLQALQKAGLTQTDIQPAFLAPPDARAAFESGSVDAWAIWDPYLAVAQQQLHARVLVNASDIVTPGSFYLASRQYTQKHPEILRIVLEEVDRVGVWAAAHPKEASELLAERTGVDRATLELLQSRRPLGTRNVGIHPLDATVVSQQQTVADTFFRAGLLPRKIDVRQAMLTPQENAALMPDQSTPHP
jgi:sulfonate transport system substrate-binding protein